MTRPFLTHALETLAGVAEPKRKYRNRKVDVDGVTFDSVKESRRWGELKLMERAGEITRLRRQVRYPLNVEGRLVCSLIADFAYEDAKGRLIVEDVKSAYTRKLAVWRIKSKLFEALYGFPIREV